MTVFNKILVPVDFSDHSRRALDLALTLADAADASVDVLHVGLPAATYQPLDRWIWGEDRAEHQLDQAVRESAEGQLKEFLQTLPPEQYARIGTRTALGAVADVVVELVKHDGYDLVVMGTHGRSGVKHMMMGSVAERTLRLSPCDVLVVP